MYLFFWMVSREISKLNAKDVNHKHFPKWIFYRNHLTENCIILFLQILSLSSPEEELEVLVKLLDGKDLLDQQTLLITEHEGVFQFMPINTEAEELTVEVSQ